VSRNALSAIAPLVLDTARIEVTGPSAIKITGTLTMRDPGDVVSPHLRSIHRAAVAGEVTKLVVDVSGLTFVNSSALRLFIDWAVWLRDEPRPYVLSFRTSPEASWQRTSFPALRSLAPDHVEIQPVH
jgi:hypothetical protein